MKIAIIGSGHIGGGLGRAWAKKGHAVVFGARDPKDAKLVALCSSLGASAATVADAVKEAEVVVLAVPFKALDDVLAQTGDLAGKIVVDCTNAVAPGMTLQYGHETSSVEELQKKIPRARVFRSFNAQGAENLANPTYDGAPATNFFCGDDDEGREVVKQLVEDVGFEAVDAGPLANARLVEPMMILWILSSQALGTRNLAFKLLRR